MCWRLEFDGHSKQAKNRLPCGRLVLNIVGLVLIIAIGVTAAIVAVNALTWFPIYKFNDNHYLAITRANDRVVNMTMEKAADCTNYNESLKMMGRLVFRCGSARMAECLPMDQRCDGYGDCADATDEVGCTDFCSKASAIRFRCKVEVNANKTDETACFHTDYKCDGQVDCTGEKKDKNDESDCGQTFTVGATGVTCGIKNSWVCKDNRQCIPSSGRCDGPENCWDGSDEEGCK